VRKTIARKWGWIACSFVVSLLPVLLFRHEIAGGLMTAYSWLADREQMERWVAASGRGAPAAFMALQILQVILAPVPGEATGFIGGYLFGAFKGFIYSSLALAIGSWINFTIGRYLGKRFVRRWIPAGTLARFDRLVKRQGVIALFILFLFPGFPKDYLCLFLGITKLPLNIFLLMASIGRMPGTLMLSLQGEFLFKENYLSVSVVFAVTVLAAVVAIKYREAVYGWVEKRNRKSSNGR
jgi:uncharacterized membrane protein YdjX (TVP38/TMEM64 family)